MWRFFERIGAQGVTLIVSIVLARLLDPVVYGTVALVTVFTSILQVFVDSGLGNALIQKKDADDLDFSSVFYCNILVCLVLYAIMFFAAPLIAKFYDMPELTAVIRVLSLTLVISGVKNVQQAYVSRNMLFKRFFFATIGGTIGAGAVGVWMAYRGYGVWALVAQNLFNLLVDTVILWITVKWRPILKFSFTRLKTLFSYGWKLLASSLIDNVYNNLRQLIIGKMYSSQELAFYNKGKQFPDLLIKNVNTSIDSVLLPAMSSEQEHRDKVKTMTRRSIRTSSYIMAPLMLGLACVAESFIMVILGEKWLPCVPFLRVICISYLFQPIHTANLNAIKALGRSDLFLKMDIIKRAIGVICLLCTMWFGVMAMVYSFLLTDVLCQIVNTWPNRKLLNYRYADQLKDILPPILLAGVMGVVVYGVGLIDMGGFTLFVQVALGVIIYIGGSVLLRLDSYKYIIDMMKKVFKKNKNTAKN